VSGTPRRDPEPAPARAAALAAALAHPDAQRLRAALAARPGVEADPGVDARPPRFAAVALVLRVGAEGGLELLFVKRAEYEGDPWSGHVAFPGGRREPGDATLWDTAARETWEETGLDLRRDAHVVGTLDELHPRTPVLPSIVVRPYVVVAAPRGPFTLSPELAAAFWMPVRRFSEPGVGVTSRVLVRGATLAVPSFVHEGHTIWGMTHRILEQFLERLGSA
jgi:8-oxo-dGTP pyrophosphatase MutT (NUDIX family)